MDRNANQIRFLQWNCRSCRRKLPELQHRSKDFDVILLSETWLSPRDNITVKGFDVVRKDRDENIGGGVAILVSNALKYQRIYNLDNCRGNIELCAIQLFLADSKLTVVSCYRPPTDNINESSWVRFLNQFDEKFIVAGDFNAHHPYWGDKIRCEEGKKIINAYER